MSPNPRAVMARWDTGKTGTFSHFVLGELHLVTVEPPWKNNQNDVSCIPVGEYEVVRFNSPSKGDVYLIKNVPGRSMVEFHVGNWAGDVSLGLRSDSEACVLPGMRRALVEGQDGVESSGKAMGLIREYAPEGFYLSIVSACAEDFIFRERQTITAADVGEMPDLKLT